MIYDLAIIGGGPAGIAAGVYAARKHLKTILITETFGGQSTDSMGIENWIGWKSIPGPEFGKLLEEHLRFAAGESVDIKSGEKVEKVEKSDNGFKLTTANGATYQAKTVLVATGSQRKKLEIPGAKEFENKGITYCASCDGPLFAGQDVAVIGGGNAAFETAAQLLSYAKSVTLLNRGDILRADETTVEKVLSHPNMTAIKNAKPKEVRGDKFVTTLVYDDTSGEHELKVGGIFVEIGLLPTTWFVEELINLNPIKQIPVDPRTGRTEIPGLWAAGDSTDGFYHQNNIAAGDAVKALEDIYLYLHAR
ncbi:MAG: FAD-dependent oxidoreductase [Candidatus Zambryskibacteria bacterium]|nr:FAD-dependent oxidoreductase [Candidatus Zambryskibacteria bacterium]